jgi:hypothetical protein
MMQNASGVPMREKSKLGVDRITVTLAKGQCDVLERIAKRNGTTLAFVVRYAVKQLVQSSDSGQLKLEFPRD